MRNAFGLTILLCSLVFAGVANADEIYRVDAGTPTYTLGIGVNTINGEVAGPCFESVAPQPIAQSGQVTVFRVEQEDSAVATARESNVNAYLKVFKGAASANFDDVSVERRYSEHSYFHIYALSGGEYRSLASVQLTPSARALAASGSSQFFTKCGDSYAAISRTAVEFEATIITDRLEYGKAQALSAAMRANWGTGSAGASMRNTASQILHDSNATIVVYRRGDGSDPLPENDIPAMIEYARNLPTKMASGQTTTSVELRKYQNLPPGVVEFGQNLSDATNQRRMKKLINAYVSVRRDLQDARDALQHPLNYQQHAGGPVDDNVRKALTEFINSNSGLPERLKESADDCALIASHIPGEQCAQVDYAYSSLPIIPLPDCKFPSNCLRVVRKDGVCVCEKCGLVIEELILAAGSRLPMACGGFEPGVDATVSLDFSYGVADTRPDLPGLAFLRLYSQSLPRAEELHNTCADGSPPGGNAAGRTFQVRSDPQGRIGFDVEAALCTNGSHNRCDQNYNGSCYLRPNSSAVPGIIVE